MKDERKTNKDVYDIYGFTRDGINKITRNLL